VSFGGQDRGPGDDHLRILHWNIHSWRDAYGEPNLEPIAALIRRTEPDVVSLTEVNESWGMAGSLARLAEMATVADGVYAWLFVPSFEVGRTGPTGGFGNALLTRLPILAAQQWQLLWPSRQYDGSEPSEPRAALVARLARASAPVWVGTTHLPRNDPWARNKALERLMTLVRGLGDRWLLCGDFNTPPSWLADGASVTAGPVTAGPVTASPVTAATITVSPDPPVATYPADDPVEPIDYCLAAPGIGLTTEVLAAAGSDHLPLLVRADLPAS
jgi:endonuclease/exonuclease/phosphatase family metal-dependent hydrolase